MCFLFSVLKDVKRFWSAQFPDESSLQGCSPHETHSTTTTDLPRRLVSRIIGSSAQQVKLDTTMACPSPHKRIYEQM